MRLNFFDSKSDIISSMKSSEYIYIYGAGGYAFSVGNYLKEQNIKINAYVVDDEYYKVDMCFEGIKVLPLSECLCYMRNNSNSFIVWAIARPSKLRTAMSDTRIPEAWITYDDLRMWQDKGFARKHVQQFEDTKCLLADELSRQTMDAYLEIFDGNPQKDIECIIDGTYFNELTANIREGAFVDGGAYIGDTAIQFALIYGKERKIYCFEPDEVNYKKLKENIRNLNSVAVNEGCWNKKTVLRFSKNGDASSSIGDVGDVEINVTAVDDVVRDDKISFVKLDVEGSELQALIGMQKLIRRDMPILAISAYHKQEDLITLPQFVSRFETESEHYKLFLRHHGCTTAELVLYAIPVQK